jgi:hypothetical protein
MPSLPMRAEVEALSRAFPHLWAAPTMSHKDRTRLLRSLVTDVTFTLRTGAATIRIGIGWRSGAADEAVMCRPAAGDMK